MSLTAEENDALTKFKTAICVPNSCSNENVEDITNYLLEKSNLVSFGSTVEKCIENIEAPSFSIFEKIVLIIGVILLVLVPLCTLYHVLISKFPRIISSLSLARSLTILVSYSQDKRESILCLNGIRVILTFWVVLFNTVFYLTKVVSYHEYQSIDKSSIFLIIVSSVNFAIDSFFVISGILATYNFMKVKANE